MRQLNVALFYRSRMPNWGTRWMPPCVRRLRDRAAALAALALLTACGAAPAEAPTQSTAAPLAATCGWTDPGCNPHTAPASVELCVSTTGAAGLLPAGVSPCDQTPDSALRVAPGAAWSVWALDEEYSVSAVPCKATDQLAD